MRMIWSEYKAMDMSTMDAISFTIFAYHLKSHVIHFGDFKLPTQSKCDE